MKWSYFWIVYFFVYSFYIVANAVTHLNTDSFLHNYYEVLTAFNPIYWLVYTLVQLQVMVNVVSLIPLFLFTYRIPLLPPFFWKILFLLRVTLDIYGHVGEEKFLSSIYYSDSYVFYGMILVLFLLITPSYFANFLYAFRRDLVLKSGPQR